MSAARAASAPTLTINRGDHVLIAGPGGSVEAGGPQGFYARDTRFVSRYRLTLNGRVPQPIQDVQVRFYSARHVMTNPPFGSGRDHVPARSLVLVLERSVADAVHEDYELLNVGRTTAVVELAIGIDGDFADMFEVRGVQVEGRHLERTTTWSDERGELQIEYRNGSFVRSLVVRTEGATPAPAWRNGRLIYSIRLAPHTSWRSCLTWRPVIDDRQPLTTPACHAMVGSVAERSGLPAHAVTIRTGNPAVQIAWEQATWDMEALRLTISADPDVAIPAAGVPWFITLFGRDSLITSMQAMPGYPELAIGTLDRLAAQQATEDDPERDMEPGKILHEIRHGEIAQLGMLPFQPYYGTHDATPLFVILLEYLHRWTGDDGLLRRFLPAAEAAIGWLDRFGDRDGDGFQEYATRSRHGFYNQGWKDAHDAIPQADGSQAALPLALCEHQGYAYDAKLRLAAIYDTLDRPHDARRLRSEAAHLFERFNEAFWWEEEGTYYLGLDGAKEPIRTVASNAGHCLLSGIVPADRAARVVSRLMASDMWSGWGIRTLSSSHAAYDPFSYHTGSVWPHDNATIATGFAAYGFRDEAAAIARALFDASEHLPGHRLPELFSGLPRAEGGPPVPYPGANVPQAWAASAVFRLVALLCGLRARADANGTRIYLDPQLPDWLGELTLRGVRTGSGTLSFHVAGRKATVLENSAGVPVERGPAPWHGVQPPARIGS